jgi:hypothetical protein
LPHGNARQIEVEQTAAQVTATRGQAVVQKEVFWSRDLLFFDAEGPGASIDIPFEVASEGQYELLAQLAHSPDYGIYTVLLDGKRLAAAGDLEHEPGANIGGGSAINAWNSELYVAEDHVLGWPKLQPGTHKLTFVCTGKDTRSTGYRLGIDTLVLARVASPVPAGGARADSIRNDHPIQPGTWISALKDPDAYVRSAAVWRATQDRDLAANGLTPLIGSLSDPSPEVRGLAAAALRQLGSKAAPALPALTGLLKDPDSGVRMMTANALAALGVAAEPATGALVDACGVPGEHPQVLRSLADALGSIGPAARSALPVLRKLRDIPRVRWNAEAAISRIEVQP